MQDLHYLHSQANDNRSREVEMSWTDPTGTKSFVLSVRIDRGMAEPEWACWENNGYETRLAWRYKTNDFDLIYDVICMLDTAGSQQGVVGQQGGLGQPGVVSTTSQTALPAGGSAPQRGGMMRMTGHNMPAVRPPQPQPPAQLPQQKFTRTGGFPAAQPSGTYPTYNEPAFQQPPMPQQPASFQQPAFQQPAPYQQPQPPEAQQLSGTSFPVQQRPRSMGYVPPFAPAAKLDMEQPIVNVPRPSTAMEGNLEDIPVSTLVHSLSMSRVTGKLVVIGEDAVGEIFFVDGNPKHAGTPSAYGDGAVRELVTWEKGNYHFVENAGTDMRSIVQGLDETVAEGLALLEQKRFLKNAGLSYESYLIRRHKSLSDAELKLMLTKGAQLDWNIQKEIYDYLSHKRTFTDLLRDHPMDSTLWTQVLFNFISCGLIEIRPPDTVRGGVLDFLGEAKANVQSLSSMFIRPETGIYSYEALLYFMEYEFYRFEAYGFPLALIVFEMQRKRDDGSLSTELLGGQAANMAAMRIDLVKRPLDTLGHFETADYALLLPNTKSSSAAFVANRILDSLTATPLAPGLDRTNLALAFGVASLPSDGDDLASLVYAARAAKQRARDGAFPIVLSRTPKQA
jgi:GGDEF domain-containing protein